MTQEQWLEVSAAILGFLKEYPTKAFSAGEIAAQLALPPLATLMECYSLGHLEKVERVQDGSRVLFRHKPEPDTRLGEIATQQAEESMTVEIPVTLLGELIQYSRWAEIALRQWLLMTSCGVSQSDLPFEYLIDHARCASVMGEEYLP